jgi:hypothetical protein
VELDRDPEFQTPLEGKSDLELSLKPRVGRVNNFRVDDYLVKEVLPARPGRSVLLKLCDGLLNVHSASKLPDLCKRNAEEVSHVGLPSSALRLG